MTTSSQILDRLRESETRSLERLNDACVKLTEKGRHYEAIKVMEKGLSLRRNLFGTNHVNFTAACNQYVEKCNVIGLNFLQKQDFDTAYKYFHKAEQIYSDEQISTGTSCPTMKAATYNNLACLYRQLGKLKLSLQYLNRALHIEMDDKSNSHIADTYLNLCVVLSQLGHHSVALKNAMLSLKILEAELNINIDEHKPKSIQNEKSVMKCTTDRLNRIATMVIALNNIGIEKEFLREYSEAIEYYQKGYNVSCKHLGLNHDLTKKLKITKQKLEKSGVTSNYKMNK